ncbi:unnamed protein product, partial [Effrenium voratum]
LFGPRVKNTAVACKQDGIILLEGSLDWDANRPLHNKQVIATLPKGYWPRRRETFFTRGCQEERRRVDIDVYGRIFCTEGADRASDGGGGYVDLSGILFIGAAQPPSGAPLDPDTDDLRLVYNPNTSEVPASSFKGRELLEKFIKRCNVYEWKLLHNAMARGAGRRMLTPLGDSVKIRGWERGNEYNLGKREHSLWRDCLKGPLGERYGISTWHTLMHLSYRKLDEVLDCCPDLGDEGRRHIKGIKRTLEGEWERSRRPGLTFRHLESLAQEIADQMSRHWDFRAQLQGLLKNDFRAPSTIEHLFPRHVNRSQAEIIKANVHEKDFHRFEEIRQFFFLHETTGSNMTHCTLMGAQDMFTTTGKWHFPDAKEVQMQLFENIAWLAERNIYHYISERQTPRFPFIEDFDIQAEVDWKEPDPGQIRPDPPDELILQKPQRDGDEVFGDPGLFLKYRAMAIHMIYPQIENLYCLVYSASGYNKGKEMMKSSFHLVWPQLVVDPDRAPVIRPLAAELICHPGNLQERDQQAGLASEPDAAPADGASREQRVGACLRQHHHQRAEWPAPALQRQGLHGGERSGGPGEDQAGGAVQELGLQGLAHLRRHQDGAVPGVLLGCQERQREAGAQAVQLSEAGGLLPPHRGVAEVQRAVGRRRGLRGHDVVRPYVGQRGQGGVLRGVSWRLRRASDLHASEHARLQRRQTNGDTQCDGHHIDQFPARKAPLGRGRHAVSFYGDGINDLLAQKVEDLPDEPPEQPEAPQPPEIHLPTDGPIGEGYEVIMDVPPSRRDGFNGPAMQPYHVGMISHAPVLMGWSPLVWQAWLLTCPRASRNRHSRAFL